MLVFVDPLLWRPAIGVARAIRRFAGALRTQKRGLIIRLGGLGDLVVATAALESLGLRPANFDWVVERRSQVWAIYLGLRHVCYDSIQPSEWRTMLGAYETVLNLEQRYGLSTALAIAMSSRVGQLIGFSTNRGSAAYTSVVDYDELDTHEIESFSLACESAFDVPKVEFLPRKRQRDAEGYSVVAIAGTGHPSRNWTEEEWVAILERFVRTPESVIVAAPADARLARRIASSMGRSCRVVAGSWSEICDVVSRAARVLTVDGGMVHVGSYFGVPVDAVFTAGRDKKWKPWSAGSRLIKRTDLPCQPCTVFGAVPACPVHFQCRDMRQWAVVDA